MIPNAVLRTPRSRADGDFYACRRCNSAKSKIDYVLAVISRAQSTDVDLAVQTLVRAVTSDRASAAQFVEMARSARHGCEGVHMPMPIEGRDLVDYLYFLAKGQHFKKTGEVYDATKLVSQVQFVTKQVLAPLETNYEARFGSNPFVDLSENPLSESLSGGDCVIWSRDNDFLFVFHRYIGAMIRVRPRTRRNYARARKLEYDILRAFRKNRRR